MALPTGRATIASQMARWADAPRPPPSSLFTLSPDRAHTPGKVVFRNTLIELIQYLPTTALVGPQPVLIVPPWIRGHGVRNLPLGPALISWLVAQGRMLFAVAWRNPDARAHDITPEDDRVTCLMAAVDVAGLICGRLRSRRHAAQPCRFHHGA